MHLLAKVSPFVFSVNSGKKAFSKRVFSDHVAQSEREGSIALCGTKCWVLWDSIGFCSPPNLWTCIYFPISFPLKFGQLPFGRAVVSEVERFGGFFFDSTKVQCNEEAFVHGMRS